MSSCSLSVISSELIEYRENKQVYKQTSFGLSKLFQMIIKLIDREFLVFLKLLDANVNYPTEPHFLIILFFSITAKQNKRESLSESPSV